jgi:hypothetical protein
MAQSGWRGHPTIGSADGLVTVLARQCALTGIQRKSDPATGLRRGQIGATLRGAVKDFSLSSGAGQRP